MLKNISHDFETYSELDLKAVGPWAYSQHPSTEVISWAMAVEDDDPVLWLPGYGKPPPPVRDPYGFRWCAWNSFFEWCIWHNTLKLPELPVVNQSCTQALALALALPRDLATCGAVLGLPDELTKNERGKELIKLLCSPDKDGHRNRDPALLEEMYEYNKQDVVAERAVKQRVRPLIDRERRIWEIDLQMNIRGVPLDTELLESAAYVYKATKGPLKKALIERTGLANPNSGKQFKQWLFDQGYDFPNLQKATIEAFLPTCNDPELVKTIRWRQALARTPLSKYGKIHDKMGTDGRYHGALSYHVATPGRWSSTGVNFQNLTHPTLEQPEIEQCIAALKLQDATLIAQLYDDPIEAMSSCLRGVMCATPGNRLIVADYKAIEARVIAWLATQRDKIQVFDTHGLVYEHTAMQLFGADSLDNVDPVQRQAGKVAELALGFQGGWRALLGMGRNVGVDIEGIAVSLDHNTTHGETALRNIVTKWRHANRWIEQLWYATERAAVRAVADPGSLQRVNEYLCFKKVPGFLLMRLPSGRQLAFCNPVLTEGKFGDPQVTYWCVSSKTHKWSRKHGYGGDFVQSATQGTARDIMAHAMPGLVDAGYDLVMLVHDEIIIEAPDGFGSLDHVIDIMCDKPEWAKGLPVAADGFEAVRYKK